MELKNKRLVGYITAQYNQYQSRNILNIMHLLIKDKISRRMMRLKGYAKVMSHQIFGFIVLLL